MVLADVFVEFAWPHRAASGSWFPSRNPKKIHRSTGESLRYSRFQEEPGCMTQTTFRRVRDVGKQTYPFEAPHRIAHMDCTDSWRASWCSLRDRWALCMFYSTYAS
jgi:hypothetical protein